VVAAERIIVREDAGRPVAGRYRLNHPVGDGGMGVVWRAVDERLDRVVAVKQLRLPPGLDPGRAAQAQQRILREARIAARLQHPNAVAVYDVTDDASAPVLVMEYLPSRSLADVLDERGALPPHKVAAIGACAAAALAAAHAAGIVHRDVKPGNILLADDGTAKITDFGISHATGDVTVTSTGLLGTPAFLAPEVARGEAPSPASDVFSLGSSLFAAVEDAASSESGGIEACSIASGGAAEALSSVQKIVPSLARHTRGGRVR
jgi:eukaryotic-like serine/threonine-protein kinase